MSGRSGVPGALVTGATGTIGRAVAEALLERGHPVVLHGFQHVDDVGAIVDGHDQAKAVSMDLTGWPAAVALAACAEGEFSGPVGVVVNCVGARGDGLMAGQAPEDWWRVIEVNLRSVFHVCRAVLPRMLQARYGRIVNLVSPAAALGSPGQTAYSAAKAGVVGLTRSLAHEVGRRGVTVNCVSPGLIDSRMTADVRPEVREAIAARTATPSPVCASEIVQTVLLCVDLPHLTGQVLSIDGGLSA